MGEGDEKAEAVVHGPSIAIANQDEDVTGLGVVGGPGFAGKVLTGLMAKLGPKATLADLKKLAEEGKTVSSPDGQDTEAK